MACCVQNTLSSMCLPSLKPFLFKKKGDENGSDSSERKIKTRVKLDTWPQGSHVTKSETASERLGPAACHGLLPTQEMWGKDQWGLTA